MVIIVLCVVLVIFVPVVVVCGVLCHYVILGLLVVVIGVPVVLVLTSNTNSTKQNFLILSVFLLLFNR